MDSGTRRRRNGIGTEQQWDADLMTKFTFFRTAASAPRTGHPIGPPAAARRCLLAALLLLGYAAPAVAEDGAPQLEIAHLIDYLQGSECRFYRNGTWYSPSEAVAHIRRKYDYLTRRGFVDSAEQFIERAASKSSMSGNTYLVQCPGTPPQPSAAWFSDELMRFRRQEGTP